MEYRCGGCREVHILSRNARFCPSCGSTSLILVIKELVEPAQKESLGILRGHPHEEDSEQAE